MLVGILKDSSISSFVFPLNFDFLHLSDLLIALFIIISSSSSSKSLNGAELTVSFCIKNSFCKFFMCSITDSSAYCCILELIVV